MAGMDLFATLPGPVHPRQPDRGMLVGVKLLLPLAINPTTVPTVKRSPRMQGLPPITAGSWLMRGKAMAQG